MQLVSSYPPPPPRLYPYQDSFSYGDVAPVTALLGPLPAATTYANRFNPRNYVLFVGVHPGA